MRCGLKRESTCRMLARCKNGTMNTLMNFDTGAHVTAVVFFMSLTHQVSIVRCTLRNDNL